MYNILTMKIDKTIEEILEVLTNIEEELTKEHPQSWYDGFNAGMQETKEAFNIDEEEA